MMNDNVGRHAGAEKAELLLAAARYLNETLELERVYDRFRELLAEAVPHNGVIVSVVRLRDRADQLRLRAGSTARSSTRRSCRRCRSTARAAGCRAA